MVVRPLSMGMATLAVALLIPALLPAQRDISGKAWTRWDQDWKVTYLMGFYAGRKADAALFREAERDHPIWDPTQREPAKVRRYKTDRMEYSARSMKYDFKLLRDLLDIFYTDPDNLPIALPAAIRIILVRQAGDLERSDFLLQRERRKELQGK